MTQFLPSWPQLYDFSQGEVFAGRAFALCRSFTVSGNGEVFELYQTGSRAVVIAATILATNSDDIEVTLIEAPTFTMPTTEVPSYNRDRMSARGATMRVYSNPTDVIGGVTLPGTRLRTSEDQPNRRDANRFAIGLEWLLRPNTAYVRRYVNNDSASSWVDLEQVWFERLTA